MKVHNPTEEKVFIVYKGVNYEIEAGGTEEVPNEVAKYWRDRIHNFLELNESEEVKEEDKPTYSTVEVSDEPSKNTATKKVTKKTNK